MVDTSDPRDFHRRLERQRELLDEADIATADRRAIKEFVQRKSGNVAVGTLKTYLRRLRRGAELAPVPLTELDEATYREWIFDLRHDGSLGRGDGSLSDSTLKSYEDVVCQFLETVCDREWASDVERTSVEDKAVDPSEMLSPADIGALRDAARHQRDVALVEFLADTGSRITLACSLRIQDLSLEGDRPTYQPNPDATGLKGAPIKRYPIIDAVADLRSYLRSTHPRPDELDAAVFHKLRGYDSDITEDDGACDPSALRNHLVRLGDRAGVDKPTNPHNFKHSAVTRMVREGYSRDQIEHRVHWSLDTDMWERYVHISAEEHNDDIFAAAGVTDSEGTADTRRLTCGNCRETLAPSHDYCPTCGTAADPQLRDVIGDTEDAALDDAVDQLLHRLERRAAKEGYRAVSDDNSRIDGHD